MKVIILAGGRGTRLWPISRTYFPKQFLKLKNMGKSFFQMTFERSLKLVDLNDIYIVTNDCYKFLILAQIEELGYKVNPDQVLLEPSGKNTLPAICYGIMEIQKQSDDTVVVFPSDHLIKDVEKFCEIITESKKLAKNYIVTFGIKPDKPQTVYGYIKPGEQLEFGYRAEKFKEKPDIEKAKVYLEKGYFWNSGIFMFKTDVFMEELQKCSHDVFKAFSGHNSINDIYQNVPSISIDYGIMEKSKRIAVVPMEIHWTDLGGFDAFYEEFKGDKCDSKGNVDFGESILIDSNNNMIYTTDDKTTALIDVDDLIVVDERDALLICKRGSSHKVKEIVNQLKKKNDAKADYHVTACRPWGSYTVLEEGFFYKIKRITVLPQKRLSYQMHYHRSEHWVVVKGTAKVCIDGRDVIVRSGESIYVRSGQKHRLENPGRVLLEVIEVQLGEYLEEDDIVRFEDDFDRASSGK